MKNRVDETEDDARLLKAGPATKGENAPYCEPYNDNSRRKCKFCGCHVCGAKDNPDKQLMCDKCDLPCHLYYLVPPLSEMPDE